MMRRFERRHSDNVTQKGSITAEIRVVNNK